MAEKIEICPRCGACLECCKEGLVCTHVSPKKERINMKIKPIHDNVLIEFFREKDKSKGGIIIPDKHRQRLHEGKVLAIGQNVKEVKKGDIVLFEKYVGTELIVEEKQYLMFKEEYILAIKTEE